jgi:thiamine pyrophosphate-dependent acetolactate synthase large subunit-like protein
VSQATSRATETINRQQLARAFVDTLTDQLVVTGIGNACNDVYAAGDRAQNFYMRGSMGAGVPIAFGLARARPQDRVICIEGDGSVLMNLGALATVGSYAPKNLAIVILDNGAYQITGGQPTHTASGVDLAAVARGCGIASSSRVDSLTDFMATLSKILDTPGPHVLVASVDRTLSDPKAYQPRRPALIKYRFMAKLGTLEDVEKLVWE